MDLVGVQECDGGWVKLKSYLAGTADYLELLSIDGALCTLYNPARFDLLSYGRQNVGTGSASYRYCAYGRLLDKESGETVFFVNTHWDHQRQDPYGHAKNTKSMIETHSSPGDALIVVGDFNQNAYINAFEDVFVGELGLRREGLGSSHDQIDLIWSNHRGSSSCNSPQDSSGGTGSDHNPVYCEFSLCADCPPPTTTTTTAAPRTDECADFAAWPNVDGGRTCAGCTALVLTAPYGGRCDRYCESFGHVCIAAAEEQNEDCEVKYHEQCSEAITDTSDMLCTCQEDPGSTPSVSSTTSLLPSTSASTSPSTSKVPSSGSFQLVEGGGRACRGANSEDNSRSYYSLGSAPSLSDCQSKCLEEVECQGIEYNAGNKRCEVWTQTIQSSKAYAGFDCYTYSRTSVTGSSTSTTGEDVTSITSTTATTTSDTCYGELSAVAAEEGAGVGEITTLSLQECQSACSSNARCQSAAFCPEFEGCYLKDKAFTGNEATRDFYDCRTIYKNTCEGSGAVSVSPAPPAPSPAPGASESLTVMTYNTVYTGYPCCGENRVPQFGSKIREVGPAVVGGQEVQDKDLLGREAGYQVVPGTGPQNPILFKPDLVTLVPGTGGFMDIPKDCYAQRTVTWAKFKSSGGGNEFWFFNTHLPHNGCEASSTNTHARIARMLLDKRVELGAAGMPTAVVCDCNPFASSGSSDGSFESNLADGGIRLIYMGRGTYGGYNGLDKIFASGEFTGSTGADHGTGSSDHPAITADLSVAR
eukprot:TRINITY_DN2447_c0_g1_i3.p1 TRINITY_DN2447_c0_g1~~TRINITY_DN2447_c0_g1_i3.p1  ORF type:complete len:887 (-),score=130.08 TRINITY_DN2447_c0_g1_i3:97-2367(-)